MSQARYEFLIVLGLVPPVSEEDVKQAYLEKVKTAHPDRGGDPKTFIRIQEAFEQATQYARFHSSRRDWLGQWVEQYAQQQAFVAAVKALGGVAEVRSVESISQSIGSDFATVLDSVVRVRLEGAAIDDAVLANLMLDKRSLAPVERLELIATRVTGAGLQNLKDMPKLVSLDLTGTPVDLESLQALLADVPRLETLVLKDTGIDWWARKKLAFTHRALHVTA